MAWSHHASGIIIDNALCGVQQRINLGSDVRKDAWKLRSATKRRNFTSVLNSEVFILVLGSEEVAVQEKGQSSRKKMRRPGVEKLVFALARGLENLRGTIETPPALKHLPASTTRIRATCRSRNMVGGIFIAEVRMRISWRFLRAVLC